METPELEVVAVNDLMSIENAAYLFKYDRVHRIYEREISVQNNHLLVGDKKILFISKKDPAQFLWKRLDINVVIESTGFFKNKVDAEKHIHAGAKTVVISAPTKSKDTPTVLHGVNTLDGKHQYFHAQVVQLIVLTLS